MKQTNYLLPSTERIFTQLNGGRIFSKLDLSETYLQIPVYEKCAEIITINTHKRLYKFLRLPFGIKVAPAIFQQVMHTKRPEQTYTVKGRSVQENLHLIREVLVGIEDNTEAALISLDHFKPFDRVDHQFLASVLKTAGLQPEFRRWISMIYHNPQAVVQMNGRRSKTSAIERSVWQGCPLSPLLYVLALEPLLRRLRDEGANLALRGVPFAGSLTASVSAFVDNISVFVSFGLDIKAVKKALGKYEWIAGAKVNFDKREGLQLSAWRSSDTLPGPFRSSGEHVCILGVWFRPDLQQEQNWSEVPAKVDAQVGTWLPVRLSLKVRAEACAVYVFPLILYRLAVLKARRLALQRSFPR